MSRYRQLMSEALKQVRAFEDADYLKPRLNPQQIANIKKVFSKKKASDITQSVKDMIKKMDIPTQLAIKQADIPHLSKLVEEEYLPEFNDAMIKTLKKEYEPMRNKTISVTNANKLGALFTRFDSNKNALEKLYGADIPFISTMAMTRLMTKHGYKADKLNKIRKEELDLLEEAELLGEGTGTIKGFRDNKEKSNMVSLAKQHGLKVKDISGGIELSGNMRKILDMQLAAQGNGLKAEEVAEGRMSDIDAMRKAGATAAEIAKELKLDVKAVKAILGEELTEEEDAEKLKAELEDKEKEIAMLKQKAETEKAKTQKKETEKLVNPETGEPLLQVGVAYKHLKDKMEKEKAAEVRMKRKDEEEKKKAVQKFKDRIKESLNLDESDASDKAKSMGLDYMKFGRYGKDGKVTHKSIGGNLTPVDKDGEPIKSTGDKDVDDVNKSLAKRRADDKAKEPKQEPAPKPKIDKFDAQKDLEKEVTDGMIDVEDDGEGGLSMNKEYEPSQDYEAERDTIAIKDYLMDKGIDEDDIYIDVDGSEEDEYLQLNVQVRAKQDEPKDEPKDDGDFSSAQIKQAYGVANDPRYKQGNYSGAVKTINKIAPGLADHPDVKKVLKRTNEQVEILEFKKMTVRIKDKSKMNKAIADLKKQNFGLSVLDKGMYKVIKVDGGSKDLNKYATDLKNFYGAEIMAEGKYTRYSDLLIQLGRMKQAGDKQGEMQTQREIDKEKRKLGIKEADLSKSQIKMVHKKADDLPKKDFKDRYGKEKGDAVRYGTATNIVKKKLGIGEQMNKEHPAKAVYEQIAGLKKKAEKSGMPYSILKKVYDRGMAAWRGGHRPGTTQQQWAFARVNSFVTKSSGTWGGADKDLAAKVRGSK